MTSLDNFIGAIQKAVLKASDTLAKKNLEVLDTYFENSDENNISKLIPKTVTVQYPQVTPKGVEVHDVHVPLIALVPVSMTKISKVKLKTRLELSLDKNDLIVGFPSKKLAKDKRNKKNIKEENRYESTTSSIEITLRPSMSPDGLKKLIEGYEKALRAQIPG